MGGGHHLSSDSEFYQTSSDSSTTSTPQCSQTRKCSSSNGHILLNGYSTDGANPYGSLTYSPAGPNNLNLFDSQDWRSTPTHTLILHTCACHTHLTFTMKSLTVDDLCLNRLCTLLSIVSSSRTHFFSPSSSPFLPLSVSVSVSGSVRIMFVLRPQSGPLVSWDTMSPKN